MKQCLISSSHRIWEADAPHTSMTPSTLYFASYAQKLFNTVHHFESFLLISDDTKIHNFSLSFITHSRFVLHFVVMSPCINTDFVINRQRKKRQSFTLKHFCSCSFTPAMIPSDFKTMLMLMKFLMDKFSIFSALFLALVLVVWAKYCSLLRNGKKANKTCI